MKFAEYLKSLKPAENKIYIGGGITIEIFKNPNNNKYSAKVICCSEHDYYTNKFGYIKYYNFNYLIKKLIKEYGRVDIEEINK